MKNIVMLHIPHCSLRLTKEFKKVKKFISNENINIFNKTITDLYTDKLFSYKKFKFIKSKISRICCDFEKFADDSVEVMSKYGLGVVYTKNIMGEEIFKPDNDYKKLILKKYYYPYHNKLDKIVDKCLIRGKKVVLVDCHSFSKDIIMNNETENLPEICIGYNEGWEDNFELLNMTNSYFQNLGYKTSVNYPYSGAIVTNKLIKNLNKNFVSIMLEINKDLYLREFKKSNNFSKMKKDILNYLNFIKNYEFNIKK